MSRTCHSVIYTFVCAGGRDRSPFPFYSSFKLVRSYRVPIRKGGRRVFFAERNREEKRTERKRGREREGGKKMKADMSYEARFSRIKLAKVAESGKIRSLVVFRSQVCGRMPRPCAWSIY